MITVLDDVDKKYNLKISENQELINQLKVSEGTIQKIFQKKKDLENQIDQIQIEKMKIFDEVQIHQSKVYELSRINKNLKDDLISKDNKIKDLKI